MTDQNAIPDTEQYIQRIKAACEKGLLTEGSVENLVCWLTEERYAQYASAIIEHIENEKWDALDDVFWTIIPFGTGGRKLRNRARCLGTRSRSPLQP